MFGVTPIVPAYGRDYKNKKDLIADFNANKDFQTPSGSYINKSQILEMNMSTIQVRYSNNRKTTVIDVTPGIVSLPPKEKKLKNMITLEEYEDLTSGYMGYCTSCGFTQEGVEDDAQNYECDDCGESTVFGAGELLMMGLVE